MIISTLQGIIKAILSRPSKYPILEFCIHHNFHKRKLILACLLFIIMEMLEPQLHAWENREGGREGGLVIPQHFSKSKLIVISVHATWGLPVEFRHEKSSKLSTDTFLGHLKFPQIESFTFPQLCMVCYFY